MARKAGSAEFRSYLDSFDRTADGAGSGKGTDRFSGKDIRTAFNNRGDLSESEGAQMVLDYALDSATEGSKMGGAARSALDKLRGYIKKDEPKDDTPVQPDKPPVQADPPAEPTPRPPTSSNSGTTKGDNSINSPISQANPQTVSGNNNQVSQDNSIRQSIDNSVDNSDNSRRFYGGSNRTFNYVGGDGLSKLYDTPVSSATMGGYYDVDDSPAASQKFMDMYIDSNRLAQRGNRREYNTYKNMDYSPNDSKRDSELNSQLNSSIDDSRRRADEGRREIFRGKSPFDFEFKLPEMPTPITSEASTIYQDTLKQLK